MAVAAKRSGGFGLFKGTAITFAAGAGLFLAAVVPLGMGKFYSFLFAQTLVFAVALLGLVIVVGLLGQFSLMHAELMGLGAGVTAALVQAHHWNFWAAGLVAIVVGYVTGMVVGLPALRIRGLALALVTLAIARLFDQLVLPSTLLAGGVGGRSITRPNIGPISLASDRVYYEVALAMFVVVLLFVLSIRRGKLGRIFRAVRESERGAAASGVSLTRYKLLGFATSAAIASLAGVMSVALTGSFTPAPYDWTNSLTLLALLSIMGAQTLSGATMAAVVKIDLPQALQSSGLKFIDQGLQLISGGTLIIQTIVAPQGAMPMTFSTVKRLVRRFRPAPQEELEPLEVPDPAEQPEPAVELEPGAEPRPDDGDRSDRSPVGSGGTRE